MKFNSKKIISTFLVIFVCLSAGSLCAKQDKTTGEKVDQAIEKAEKAANQAKDKAKEVAENAKDKASEIHDKAKEKAHEGIDKA